MKSSIPSKRDTRFRETSFADGSASLKDANMIGVSA